MLSLDDLLQFAASQKMPAEKRRGMVREYLQTLALFYMQQTDFARRMVFIGGTALRFFYNLERFSEDLDFNYLGTLKKTDIQKLLDSLVREFEKEGIKSRYAIRKSQETYFHWKIYLQFPDMLQIYQCGGKKGHALHAQEQLSIQLDFQNLGKRTYPVSKKIISRFGRRFLFNTTELDMFLAEKANAMVYRKPPRGRDAFDFMSLVHWGARVNLGYLRRREISVKSREEFIEKMKRRVKKLDFKKLTDQLAPFLFRHEDVEIMRNFPDIFDELMNIFTSR